ncbi:MAG: ATP-dependent Clp protease adaptor ClpS [Phycisphaerales bacterium]|nr:ATP-dependent Clp protease adaptor ClpS [Phycisphaerales bacterium]
MDQLEQAIVIDSADTGGSTATAVAPVETRPAARMLPPYRVLLHNDDVNDMMHVVRVIVELTPLSTDEAIERMFEAHQTGVALLVVTHRERAELYCEQFQTFEMTATMEPDA